MNRLLTSLSLISAFACLPSVAEPRPVAATPVVTESYLAFPSGNLNAKIIEGKSNGGYDQSDGLTLSVDLFTNACSLATFKTVNAIDRAGIDSTIAVLSSASQIGGERKYRNVLLAERINGVLHCKEENRNRMSLVLSNGMALVSSPSFVVRETTGQDCINRYNEMTNQ